ncbi:MAG TPA: MFS transporter [Anaerolineales bacterium]|nr:MFS transporter [Anaerolineales bacterium]
MNRNLIFVAFALLFWGVGEGMFFNFVPIYLETEFDLGKQQIGNILGMFGFFMAITHIPAGHLADRFGRRQLLIFAWVLGLLSTLVMGFAKVLPLYMVGVFGYGLTAFVASPLGSYVTAARGKWSVGTALSLTTATFSFGMALGPVTGGWIAEQFGMRMSYLVAAVIFFFSTMFILFIKRQPIDKHDPESPPPNLWHNFRFISFVMIFAFAVFSMYLSQPLTPNFLTGVRDLKLSETGLVFSAGALGNSVLALIFSRFNPRRGFLLAQVLVAAFAVLMWKGTGLPVFMLGYFLFGGFRAARPLALAQARELVHNSQMGVAYGTMETVGAIIFIIAPPIAGFIFERDPFVIYPIAIGLIAASIVIGYLFSPRKEQVESQPSTLNL